MHSVLHTAYAQSKRCCSSTSVWTCHCFPSAPVARFLMGLHAPAQAEHTNVGEFLKLDKQMDCNLATLAAGSRQSEWSIVCHCKDSVQCVPLSHRLCACWSGDCKSFIQSGIAFVMSNSWQEMEWNYHSHCGGRQLSLSSPLSLPLSLSVFARFVFALALSGCRELQLEEVISKCYLWRSFSVARLGQKLKIIFLLYGTHTQTEGAREQERKKERHTQWVSVTAKKINFFHNVEGGQK